MVPILSRIILGLVCLSCGIVQGETLLVPSEYSTIHLACWVAAPGDTVLVSPGVYAEVVNVIRPRIMVLSAVVGGAVMRSSMTPLTVRADSVTVSGFNIEHTSVPSHSNAVTLNGKELLVESCTVVGGRPGINMFNTSGTLKGCVVSGGTTGIELRGSCRAVIDECQIRDNVTSSFGGGVFVMPSFVSQPPSTLELRKCMILNNRVSSAGGGLAVDGSADPSPQVFIDQCVFSGNEAPIGAAIFGLSAPMEVRSSTVVRNVVPGDGAALEFHGGTAITIENCIIAFNDAAGLLCLFGTLPLVSCTDLFGNADDTLCGVDGNGNFSLDPLFCSIEDDDLSIHLDSPCAPGHSPPGCGLIGAIDPGCVDPVSEATWGSIKARFNSEIKAPRPE